MKVGKIFKTEDLTTNYQDFKDFVKEITNDTVIVDDEQFSQIMKIKKVNVHKKQDFKFEDWQIDIIKKVVQEKAWKMYAKLGYQIPEFI